MYIYSHFDSWYFVILCCRLKFYRRITGGRLEEVDGPVEGETILNTLARNQATRVYFYAGNCVFNYSRVLNTHTCMGIYLTQKCNPIRTYLVCTTINFT